MPVLVRIPTPLRSLTTRVISRMTDSVNPWTRREILAELMRLTPRARSGGTLRARGAERAPWRPVLLGFVSVARSSW